MTADDLRAWQSFMGYTYETAAAALGVSRSAYADLASGISRATGRPKDIDRRTALACAALAAGLAEWAPKK
jgi:transcriptional regulator with XRE-family HTH domain